MTEQTWLEGVLTLFGRGDALGIIAAVAAGAGWLVWRWMKRKV